MTSLPLDNTQVDRHRAWHDIIAFGSTHDQMTGVVCHHRRWAAHTVERRQAWYDITSLGKHTQSDYFIRHMMSPLDNIHSRMTSVIACHHRPMTAHKVEQRQALHDITALRQHTLSTI